MTDENQTRHINTIATEAFELLGSGRQVVPFSARHAGFDMTEAYTAAARVCDLRRARGETPVGRKIGFTNSEMWATYGVSGPIWGYMFDATVRDLAAGDGRFALAGLAEPLIEPEIALHLSRAPHVGMSDGDLIDCIDWVAHGFEIVQSIFPGWKFAAADTVAAYGMHGAYLIGERHAITDDLARWTNALANFSIELKNSGGVSRLGDATNVLGGPLKALRYLIDELARYPETAPLRAGEIVTTGTLVAAMPVAAGETWSTTLDGIGISGLQLRFS
jgi:2-oxo-3-hexenedioate decarboxylase